VKNLSFPALIYFTYLPRKWGLGKNFYTTFGDNATQVVSRN